MEANSSAVQGGIRNQESLLLSETVLFLKLHIVFECETTQNESNNTASLESLDLDSLK